MNKQLRWFEPAEAHLAHLILISGEWNASPQLSLKNAGVLHSTGFLGTLLRPGLVLATRQ